MFMERTIKILITYESDAFVQSITRLLQNQHWHYDCQKVKTVKELQQALKDGRWHVILADYTNKRLSAKDILGFVRSQHLQTPVIQIANTLSEDQTINVIQMGVKDVLTEDSLARLPVVIMREIDRYEQFQAIDELQDKAERYEALYKRSMNLLFIHDFEGRFLDANPAALEKLGYGLDEIRALNFTSLTEDENELKKAKTILQEIEQNEIQKYPTEFWLKTKPGDRICIETKSSVIRKKGKPFAIQGIGRDITGQKIAEEQLQNKSQLQHLITQIATNFIKASPGQFDEQIQSMLKAIGEVTKVDRCYVFLIFGDTISNTHEWCDKGVEPQIDNLQNLPSDMLPWWMSQIKKSKNIRLNTLDQLPPQAEAEKQLLADQNIKSLLAVPIVHGSELLGFLGFDAVKEEKDWQEDIVVLIEMMGTILGNAMGRKNAQMNLTYKTHILNNIGESAIAADLNKNITYWNRAAERLYSWRAHEVIGKNIHDVIHIDMTSDERDQLYQKILRDGRWRGEVVHYSRSGRKIFTDWSITIIYDQKREALGTVSITRDISHQKEAERILKESEERFRVIYENTPNGFARLKLDGSIESANAAFLNMLGYNEDDLYQKSLQDIINSEQLAKEFNQLANGAKSTYKREEIFIHKNGNLIFGILNINVVKNEQDRPEHIIASVLDITQRKRSEEEKARLQDQLNRAQKLETIGTLAGGIAHDFNNILTPILGYADMALTNRKESDPLYSELKAIKQGANRARELVNQMLTFSKPVEKERKPVKLQSIIRDTFKFLRNSVPAIIDMHQKIDENCGYVQADAAQIHQLLMNLCANAYQAIGDNPGKIVIEIRQVVVDSIIAKYYNNLQEKEYVRLSVSDTGIGMDEATVNRIFEPFFTTKEVDKGTGMGLSVVHGIVKGHDGEIMVHSEPGKGSVFHIYLPILKSTEEPSTEKYGKHMARRGKSTILVVDDEVSITGMIEQMLTSMGHHVVVNHSSTKALQTFRQEPDTFDLILTDLTMPKMTGLELAEEMHKLRPNMPIILMTGYGTKITPKIKETYNIREILGKPL
ncbi:MAG: PAS domain S-box protein, partial [Caldithrix sp.]|nr:PAS domain S-box protein [Caldithrix sp.]